MKVKSNLDAIIYEHIVDSLILGEYSMGQTILLDEFAEKYEVSRTPVTQAVKLLVSDGLLEAMSNGRVRVPVFDKEQMRKICEVRLLFEIKRFDSSILFSANSLQLFLKLSQRRLVTRTVNAHLGSGFIHDVDGLVRQEAIRHVTD